MRPTKEERQQFKVDYPADTDYAAFARLLQSKWRSEKGFHEGKLGNYLETEFAKTNKSNFLTDNIRQLVTREIAHAKTTGGLIAEPRIWNNLLSSQPLCFNLFGELHVDLALATTYFKRLFPGRLDSVTAVKFEYSPGRRDAKYLGDNSAFDVFIEYAAGDKRGFMGIEVKYAESLKEETPGKAIQHFKEHYAALSNRCGIFKPDSVPFLRQPPLSQIWRDHLLSIATRQDYDEGFFVFLFPARNQHCQRGVDRYIEHLAFDSEEQNGFYPRHLEDFINTLTGVLNTPWTTELKQRYLGEEG